MEEVAADGVAHLVFPGRRATGDDLQIRDHQKSDLGQKNQKHHSVKIMTLMQINNYASELFL